MKRPPTPIDPLTRFDPTEGMTYVAAGFPLGGMLGKVTDSKGNPSVTITGGRIAALRRDDYGQLDLLQVDGSLQPGNSGGPVVDEKTGKLIGVAVAKVGSVDTIGFVIPASELRRALAGRVVAVDLTLRREPARDRGTLVQGAGRRPKQQPYRESCSTSLRPPPWGHSVPTPMGPGRLCPTPLPSSSQKDDKTASASGRVKVNLSGEGDAKRKVMIQTAHRDLAGQLIYSRPKEYELPEKPGRIVARRTPASR